MKRNITLFNALLAGLFVLSACSNEESVTCPATDAEEEITLTASAVMPTSPVTRLNITDNTNAENEDDRKLVLTWKTSGETFSILKGTGSVTPRLFKETGIVNGSDEHTASFKGNIAVDYTTDFYAVYPALDESTKATVTNLTLDMTVQEGTLAGLENKLYMWDAKKYPESGTLEFEFQHLTCVLKVNLQLLTEVFVNGSAGKKATTRADEVEFTNVTLTADEMVTNATVDLSQTTISYTATGDSKKTISLEGGTFKQDSDVFFCLIPGTLNNLIVSAKIGDDDYSVILPIESNTKFEAGSIYTVDEAGLTKGHIVSATSGFTSTDIQDYATIRVVGELPAEGWSALNGWSMTSGYDRKLDLTGITNISIAASAFHGNAATTNYMTEVTLPEKLKKIEAYAFSFCTSLTSITIPSEVEEIGERAFYACRVLATVYCKPEVAPTVGTNVFQYGIGETLKIYYPSASATSYTSKWSNYSTYLSPM